MLTSSNRKCFFTNTFVNFYPWLIIGFSALFIFYKFILQVSPSVMTAELMQAFHIHAAGLGNLAAMYFYAYLIAQFLVGPLLDRFSPRCLSACAIALCAIGTFCFARTGSLFLASLARGLIGVGVAFATTNYMKMSAIWFGKDKAAFIDGLLASAAMLGALCGQVPLLLLIAKFGWKQGLIDCAWFGIALAVLYILVVRDKPLDVNNELKKCSPKMAEFSALLCNKQNWLLALYAGLAFTPLAVLGGLWGNPFFITVYHLTPAQAASLSSSMFLGLGMGAPLWGVITDRWLDRIVTMTFGTTLALLALMSVIYAPLKITYLNIVLFIFGLGTGAFMSCYALGKDLNQAGLAATVISLINSGDALLGSITEPIIGKFLDIFWQGNTLSGIHIYSPHAFRMAFSILPIYLLSALISLLFLFNTKKINSYQIVEKECLC